MGVEIPVGTPLVYELDENTLQPKRHYYLGEPQVIGNKGKSDTHTHTHAHPLTTHTHTHTHTLFTAC